MNYRRTLLLVGACLLASCKIEETPPEYFDHRDQVVSERGAAVIQEIESRLRAFTNALSRGDAGGATTALGPAEGARNQIATVLDDLAGEVTSAAVLQEVHVSTAAEATVAWFNASVAIPRAQPIARSHLRITGVYVREAGDWELVQVHFSYPLIAEPAEEVQAE